MSQRMRWGCLKEGVSKDGVGFLKGGGVSKDEVGLLEVGGVSKYKVGLLKGEDLSEG